MEPLKDTRSYRISSIDFLRGLVIVIMAIDHVRDFFMAGGIQDPMAQPDVPLGLYLTRWVTHFCAPVFVLLAGTSAGLMTKRKTSKELGIFLFKRGVWLIFVEIFIINSIVTFWASDVLGIPGIGIGMQVIWAIGGSMVVLSVAQLMGRKLVLILGILILTLSYLLNFIWPPFGIDVPFWVGLYTQSATQVGPFTFIYVYPLLPWIGVMFLGFGSSSIFNLTPSERKSTLIKTGTIMLIAMLVLRLFDIYGEPNHWQWHVLGLKATILDFMNLTKYPPSLLFIMATLGPMAILCAYAENFKGWINDTMVMFGRVPFFFYVAHFALIHALSILYGMTQGYEANQFFTIFMNYPEGYGTGLGGVYLVWILVLIILYPACRWMAQIKRNRKDWWLSYV